MSFLQDIVNALTPTIDVCDRRKEYVVRQEGVFLNRINEQIYAMKGYHQVEELTYNKFPPEMFR